MTSFNCFGDKVIICHHKSTWWDNKSTCRHNKSTCYLCLVISPLVVTTCRLDVTLCRLVATTCRLVVTTCRLVVTLGWLVAGRLLQNFIYTISALSRKSQVYVYVYGHGQVTKTMKITVSAITFEPDVVVSVLTYDIPFLSHMTSYMTWFVKWPILNRLTPNLEKWCNVPHKGHKTNYVVIGAMPLMLLSFCGRVWLHYE